MAGLAAALTAHDKGKDVLVVEASDGVGGRVRTDESDGFLLDRGFQILLTAYPVAQRVLDYDALDLRRFQPGALIQTGSGQHRLGDPLRRYEDLVETAKAPVGSPTDKLRLLGWLRKVRTGTVDDVWRAGECTTAVRLSDLKFSEQFIDSFLRPLFAGITLDPELAVTSRFTEFVFRMLSEGYGAVPSRGMGQIGSQLADRLPEGAIWFNSPVESVDEHSVTLASGETVDAEAVVVATDMDSAEKLVGTPALGWNGVTTWWFAADSPPYQDPILFLNGTGSGAINNVAVLSNVSPHYAPADKALIAASSPGQSSTADERQVRDELTSWFGPEVADWELLRVDAIERSQPRHLPGEAVPAPVKLESGIWVAGDHRQNPSINGALQSGRAAARSVLSSTS
jgi:phytoene dehydrogenase-like protein